MKTLGKTLKTLRISKGLSQEDLAFELNISLSAYSKIERQITDISLSRLEQLAKFYGMTVVDLLNYGTSISPDAKSFNKLLEDKEKELIRKDKEIMKLQKDIIKLMGKKR